MAKVKILLDPVANTMNLWWDDPKNAFRSEETDDANSNDVIVKDREGRPIGVEVIGLLPSELNVAKWWRNSLGIKKDIPFLLHG